MRRQGGISDGKQGRLVPLLGLIATTWRIRWSRMTAVVRYPDLDNTQPRTCCAVDGHERKVLVRPSTEFATGLSWPQATDPMIHADPSNSS